MGGERGEGIGEEEEKVGRGEHRRGGKVNSQPHPYQVKGHTTKNPPVCHISSEQQLPYQLVSRGRGRQLDCCIWRELL